MGRPSLTVGDHMRPVLVSFREDTEVLRAVHLLIEHELSGAPVLDRFGNIAGFLSEKDCMAIALEAGYHGDAAGTVGRLMTKKIVTIDVDDSILAAARIFSESSIKTLPVTRDGLLAGMLARRDVLKAFEQQR